MALKKNFSKDNATCSVTFSYNANVETNTVQVLGDFNEWNAANAPILKKTKNIFSASLDLQTGRTYQFRYLINGNIWDNDHNADAYVNSPFPGIQNSVLTLDIPSSVVTKPAAKKTVSAPKAKATPAKKEAMPIEKVVKDIKLPTSILSEDDLTKIEGIGPKIAEILKTNGINTFALLSKSKPATIKSILEAQGKRYVMHDPTTWPKQATLAAKGDWAKLTTLQDELKGGR